MEPDANMVCKFNGTLYVQKSGCRKTIKGELFADKAHLCIFFSHAERVLKYFVDIRGPKGVFCPLEGAEGQRNVVV